MNNKFTIETLNNVLEFEKEKLENTTDEIKNCHMKLQRLNDTSNLLVKNIKDIEMALNKINK